MKKTSVSKYCKVEGGDEDIGFPRQRFNIAIYAPAVPQSLPNYIVQAALHFRAGAANTRHYLTAFRLIENVSHEIASDLIRALWLWRIRLKEED